MAPRFDIQIEQGSRFERKLRRRAIGAPLTDLTGWSARGQLRRRRSDTEAAVSFHFVLEPIRQRPRTTGSSPGG